MNDDRINELESKIAFQEDAVNELNAAVYEQHKRIEELQAVCRKLAERLDAQSSGDAMPETTDTPPPHY